MSLLPERPLLELAYASVLFTYILLLLALTRRIYKFMVSRGLRENVAIYYNRKIIHIAAGGLVAALTPIIFTSPLIPLAFALIIALLLYIPHKRGHLLGWFQTSENSYEVNFAIAWGVSILVVWLLTGNPWWAVIPALFISIGDAVTGIIRNGLYGRRTKAWIGNLGMLAVTIPIGYHLAEIPGLVAAILSSIVEHFEYGPFLDDNVLIALTSSLVLIASKLVL